jgi:hypothetical protein
MAKVEQFGVIPVARGLRGQLHVRKEIVFPSENEALHAGKIFAEVLGGAVAFKRVNDPQEGTIGQGVIIARYGLMAETSADVHLRGPDDERGHGQAA